MKHLPMQVVVVVTRDGVWMLVHPFQAKPLVAKSTGEWTSVV